MINNKIKDLNELGEIVKDLKAEGKKIVQCHGCFDIVHIGHVKQFYSAKEQGDVLIVTVTPDRFISKGPGRPFFTESLRLDALAALEVVDYVALNEWETAVETIELLKPDVYVKGKEVLANADVDKKSTENGDVSNLQLEIDALNKNGGRLYLTEIIIDSENNNVSSSKILNQIGDLIPSEAKIFLQDLKKEISTENLLNTLKKLKDVKILVIGDAIIDEYVYCAQLDKTGKEPLIAYKFTSSQKHAGGALSVANNVAQFSKKVSLLTSASEDYKKFIKKNLAPSINQSVFIQKGNKTILKRRYIDSHRSVKRFEVYNTDSHDLEEDVEKEVLEYLDSNLSNFDMVLIADFGHGFMTKSIINRLANSKVFLALNCQLNAGNMGYNFVTKYPRADFISLNEKEIRLPMQERTADIKKVISKLNLVLGTNKINVTRAKQGMTYYEDGYFFESPSFNKNPLDTIGAGDAVLSLTSLLAYAQVNPKTVPFFGNCMGALAVQIMGNERHISSIELEKFIKYILK